MDAKFYIKGLNKSSNNNQQQNYIFFPIQDSEELTTEEKAALLEKIKNGTILNTVLVTPTGFNSRILAYRNKENLYSVFYFDLANAEITQAIL